MTAIHQKIKSVIVVFLVCLLSVCSLVSCSGGIDTDEAKAFIGEFLEAIEAEDYEKAETFLHPDRPADLETFLLNIEESENLDFQAGITVEKYTFVSASYYDSTVDGSTYELTIKTKVAESEVKFTIEIVQNENGYGIYNLDIDT